MGDLSSSFNMLSLNPPLRVLANGDSKVDFTNVLLLVFNFALKFAIVQIEEVYSGENIT